MGRDDVGDEEEPIRKPIENVRKSTMMATKICRGVTDEENNNDDEDAFLLEPDS